METPSDSSENSSWQNSIDELLINEPFLILIHIENGKKIIVKGSEAELLEAWNLPKTKPKQILLKGLFDPVYSRGESLVAKWNPTKHYTFPYITPAPVGSNEFLESVECKELSSSLYSELQKKFDGYGLWQGFPNNSEAYKAFSKLPGFSAVEYIDTPKWTAVKVLFSYQCILSNWNNSEGIDYIKSYLAKTRNSFGEMPSGYGNPLFLSDYFENLTSLIDKNKELDTAVKDSIIEYIALLQNPSQQGKSKFEVLLESYDEWLNYFPFELTYLSHLRDDFYKTMPFISDDYYDKESGTYYGNFVSSDELSKILAGLTNEIITELNVLRLYEEGKLTKLRKVKLELLLANRKIRLKKGYLATADNTDEGYKKAIRDWLKDEKDFVDELMSLLPKKMKDQSKSDSPEILQDLFMDKKIFESCVDVLKKVTPAILNEKGQYIGKSKGAFVVWIDQLRIRNLIKPTPNRRELARLISTEFHPFKIDGSMFDKVQPKAEALYEKEFKILLSQIEHL